MSAQLAGSGRVINSFDFTRHRLSPLALLLPVLTFCTMEGGDSDLAKLTVPNLKALFKARSQNVSGNKQKLVARAIG